MRSEGRIIITDDKKSICINPLWIMFPNGQEGIRLDYVDQDRPFSKDFGTIYYNKKEKYWKIINW